MKKIVLVLTAVLTIFSCERNNPNPNPEPTSDNIIVTGHITENTHWFPGDTAYEMVGKVVVDSGVTLNIHPGTLVYGRLGDGASSTALVISRGAKIIAVGTPEDPIIFTSALAATQNLDETDNGLWGGIVILGYAPISADASPALIEGIPANETYGLYGGSNSLDSSGILRYVSIRHAGALIGAGNELNGLTLGGVGSHTTIDKIEVVGNLDDGVEFFGGSVNATNLLVWAQGDDAFDVDQGWSGTLTNYIAIEGPTSDHALELDGGEGTSNPPFTIENGTFISTDGVDLHFRDWAQGFISYTGQSNIEADTNTSVMVDTIMGANFNKFTWTWAAERGAL